MDEQTGKVTNKEEIDFSLLSKKVGNFLSDIQTAVYNGFLFIKRNIIVIAALFLLGIIIGYFLDRNTKIYEHRVIVSPNFGSVDYLYAKIDLLESKINEGDTVFLKSIGIQKSNNLLKVEIEPVVDIYNFVNNKTNSVSNAQNTQNFELVKLLSESGDINKIIEEETTSKNYAHHKILLTTDGSVAEQELVKPILEYLNTTDYYNRMTELYIANIDEKLIRNVEMISQIDKVLTQMTLNSDNNKRNEKLVFYNDNNQINEILNTKNSLIGELASLKMDRIVTSKVIKDDSKVLNVRNRKGLNNKLKLVLPFLFVGLYIGFSIFISFIRYQSRKMQSK